MFLLSIREPDWVTLLILGAVLGAVLGSIDKLWKVLKYIYRYFFETNHIEGKWHSYHWTYIDAKPQIVASSILINKGIRNKFKFSLEQINTNLKYSGRGEIEGDTIIFSFRANKHAEKTITRFPYILASKTRLYGIWLSYDHDKQIAAGGILLSKEEIPLSEIPGILRLGIKSEKNAILMHLEQSIKREKK